MGKEALPTVLMAKKSLAREYLYRPALFLDAISPAVCRQNEY